MAGSQGSAGSGDLERLTRKMQVTAYVSGGLAVFSIASIFTPAGGIFLILLFYPAMFVLLVSAVGAVVGRLLLAARRDEQPVVKGGSSQVWYE